MAYAKGTTVPVSKSMDEIRGVLEKAGADEVAVITRSNGTATVAFVLERDGQRLPVVLNFEPAKWEDFRTTANGRWRDREQSEKAADAETRRRARVLLLLTKAKCEAVELGVTTMAREFLHDVMLPDGRVVGEALAAQMAGALQGGALALPMGPTS